jgi:hypothetical protein
MLGFILYTQHMHKERMDVDLITAKSRVLHISNWSEMSLGYIGTLQVAIYKVNFRVSK